VKTAECVWLVKKGLFKSGDRVMMFTGQQALMNLNFGSLTNILEVRKLMTTVKKSIQEVYRYDSAEKINSAVLFDGCFQLFQRDGTGG
jgi:hypothetical protein